MSRLPCRYWFCHKPHFQRDILHPMRNLLLFFAIVRIPKLWPFIMALMLGMPELDILTLFLLIISGICDEVKIFLSKHLKFHVPCLLIRLRCKADYTTSLFCVLLYIIYTKNNMQRILT